MPKMTPKEALEHVRRGMKAGHDEDSCLHCRKALSVLRSLVEHPTVAEVRDEIVRRVYPKNPDNEKDWVVICELQELLDFIDRKGEHK